ncbi:MAG: helix-turn-helix domain-containing protein [Desulfovibrionaceae bacterium]|nr:helix-turn-helix domain-containing protein [Desulfovibrionaceae bacterium]
MVEKKYLNEKEVADLTGISMSTLRRDRFLGQGIPYCKLGRSVRYNMADVLTYMESHKVNPGQAAA